MGPGVNRRSAPTPSQMTWRRSVCLSEPQLPHLYHGAWCDQHSMPAARYNCCAAQRVREEGKRNAPRRGMPGPGHPEAQPSVPLRAGPRQGLLPSCPGDLCQAWRTMPGKRRKQSLPGPGHKSWPAQIRERTDIPHAPHLWQAAHSPWALSALFLGRGVHPLPSFVAQSCHTKGRAFLLPQKGAGVKKGKGNRHRLRDSGLRCKRC